MNEYQSESKKSMSDEKASGNFVHSAMIGILGVLTLVALFMVSQLDNRFNSLEAKLETTETKLEKKISTAEIETSSAKQQNDDLAMQLSKQSKQAQKEIAARAAKMRKEQMAAINNLTEQQKQQQAALEGVKTDVGGVISDVGGVKTDVNGVKTDLEDTKAKLSTAVGELNGHSSLIAGTRDELEILKHKGDRNYYDFTLAKNKMPQTVSTVQLLLKKTDPKKNQFTLVITADDRPIEKKDRGAGELLQFITGRERMLYELVVFNVDKNKITGYLSTPKNAPTPITATEGTSQSMR